MFSQHLATRFSSVSTQVSYHLPPVLATLVVETLLEPVHSWRALSDPQHSSVQWSDSLGGCLQGGERIGGFVNSDDGELYCGVFPGNDRFVLVRLTGEGSEIMTSVRLPGVKGGVLDSRTTSDMLCVTREGMLLFASGSGELFATALRGESSPRRVSASSPVMGSFPDPCMLRAHANTIFVRDPEWKNVCTWEETADVWTLLFQSKDGAIKWFVPVSPTACACTLVTGRVQVIEKGGAVIWERYSASTFAALDVIVWSDFVFFGLMNATPEHQYAVLDLSDDPVLHRQQYRTTRHDSSVSPFLGIGRTVVAWWLAVDADAEQTRGADRIVWASRY